MDHMRVAVSLEMAGSHFCFRRLLVGLAEPRRIDRPEDLKRDSDLAHVAAPQSRGTRGVQRIIRPVAQVSARELGPGATCLCYGEACCVSLAFDTLRPFEAAKSSIPM